MFAPPTCVVCGKPLPFPASGQAPVCDRPACRFVASFRAHMPPDAFERFLKERSRSLRSQDRQREEAEDALRAANALEERENRARWRQALAAMGAADADYPMLPVPHNTRRLVNLPEGRRRDVRDRLTRLISAALALPGEAEETGGGPPQTVPPAARYLQAGCVLCAGSCCLVAGNKAYLTPATLRRVMRERPDLRPRDLLALYLSHLPNRILEDGCAFQGEKGCTLPPVLRGATCLRYYCFPLRDFARDYDPRQPPKGVVFIVRDREHWDFPLGADRGILKAVLVTGAGASPLDPPGNAII